LRRFDHTGYKIKLIVSDRGPGNCLLLAIKRHYPGIPHQLDWEHEVRDINEMMPPPPASSEEAKRRKNKNWQNENEQQLYRKILEMRKSINEVAFRGIWKGILNAYEKTTDRGRVVIDMLRSDLPWLKARYQAGKDVASSNSAEFGFSRFNQLFLTRMKGIHAHSDEEARKTFNVLWAAYRAKPLDSSLIDWKKGKAPLELAGVKIKKNDIWQFIV